MRKPPSDAVWGSMVQLSALRSAIYDRYFAPNGGEPRFEAWSYERNRQLLSSAPLRAIAAAPTPQDLLASHAARWSALYRGSSIGVLDIGTKTFLLRLTYPPHAFPRVSQVALVGALRATVELAGGAGAEVVLEEESPRASRYAVRWR